MGKYCARTTHVICIATVVNSNDGDRCVYDDGTWLCSIIATRNAESQEQRLPLLIAGTDVGNLNNHHGNMMTMVIWSPHEKRILNICRYGNRCDVAYPVTLNIVERRTAETAWNHHAQKKTNLLDNHNVTHYTHQCFPITEIQHYGLFIVNFAGTNRYTCAPPNRDQVSVRHHCCCCYRWPMFYVED